jgi:hypothetical protein
MHFYFSHHLFLIPRVTCLNKQSERKKVVAKGKKIEKQTCFITQVILISVNYQASLPWE